MNSAAFGDLYSFLRALPCPNFMLPLLSGSDRSRDANHTAENAALAARARADRNRPWDHPRTGTVNQRESSFGSPPPRPSTSDGKSQARVHSKPKPPSVDTRYSPSPLSFSDGHRFLLVWQESGPDEIFPKLSLQRVRFGCESRWCPAHKSRVREAKPYDDWAPCLLTLCAQRARS